jgi:hypothetical protein
LFIWPGRTHDNSPSQPSRCVPNRNCSNYNRGDCIGDFASFEYPIYEGCPSGRDSDLRNPATVSARRMVPPFCHAARTRGVPDILASAGCDGFLQLRWSTALPKATECSPLALAKVPMAMLFMGLAADESPIASAETPLALALLPNADGDCASARDDGCRAMPSINLTLERVYQKRKRSGLSDQATHSFGRLRWVLSRPLAMQQCQHWPCVVQAVRWLRKRG